MCWIQRRIRSDLPKGFRVLNDYGLMPGPRRSRSTDLGISGEVGVALVAEFKFEPCARRSDTLPNKLPVIAWSDFLRDVDRCRELSRLE